MTSFEMGTPEPAMTPHDDVLACVAETLGIPSTEIDPGAPLLTLGLDSFTAVRLRRRLRERTGVGLALSDFFGDATVKTVAAKVGESRGPAPAPSAPADERPMETHVAEPPPPSRADEAMSRPPSLSADDWSALRSRGRSHGLDTEEIVLAAFGLVLDRWQLTGPIRLTRGLPGVGLSTTAALRSVRVDVPAPGLTCWDGFASYAAEVRRTWPASEAEAASVNGSIGAIEFHLGEGDGALRLAWHPAGTSPPDTVLHRAATACIRLLRRLAVGNAWSDRMLGWDPGFYEVPSLDHSPFPGAGPKLDDPFRRAAERAPEAPALLGHGCAVTFSDLAGRAETIAAALTRSGAGVGDLVAVSCEKGPGQIAAVLGVMRAGAGYVPIDPAWPSSRVESVCSSANIAYALTGAHANVRWPGDVAELRLDGTGRLAGAGPETEDPAPPAPDDLAYVIFTSGSTGTPKGVAIEHRAARTTVDDITDRFSIGAHDRMLALSALGFDLSVYDIFGVLGAGGTLVLPERGRLLDPEHWLDLIDGHGVTLWNTAPALMEMLVENAEADPEAARARLGSLRLVLLSGDWIPVTLPDRLRALARNAEVISLGGATEASIWSICQPIGTVDPDWSSIPYGRPLRDQFFLILDPAGRPCPVGTTGELHIGGQGLARGYAGNARETSARFVVHEFLGERLYRTGDLGRWRSDGTIEFLGRTDRQVKVRGHRIELGEIEAILTRQPAVRQCVASVVTGPDSEHRLVAHVVARDASASPAADRLIAALREHLPAYMVPSVIHFLDGLPVTVNGKIDYAALPNPYLEDGEPLDPRPEEG